jgi:lysophospholipase L1-like esterase
MRRGGRVGVGSVLCIAVALSGVNPALKPDPAAAADPVRILLVGDSVTQGSAGDWTWRYRLWKHLEQTAGGPVDLVGPRTDLWDDLADKLGNHDYIDPAFDQDHASRWGMTFAFADNPIGDLVETYQPDVVVEMLGFNDLSIGRPPADIGQDIRNFVTAARSVNPGIDVVLAETVQTWFPGVPQLNALLTDAAAELDGPVARVVVADTDAGFTSSEHTYDTSHPDAQGEVLIAAGVSDALASLGVGAPATRPLPAVPRGPRLPAVLSGARTGSRATLTWVPSPGAWTTQVHRRDVTSNSRWRVVADEVSGTTWRSSPLTPGHRYEYRVLPRKGWRLAAPDVASDSVKVRMPQLPGRPKVQVAPRPGRAVVTWRAARADIFTVRLRRPGRPWSVVAADRVRPRLVLRGLRAGVVYAVRVVGANAGGTGPMSDRVRFRLP